MSHEARDSQKSALQRAVYDPSLQANWLEMTIQSKIKFPERNPKKNYVYLYTLRIWDGNKTSMAA